MRWCMATTTRGLMRCSWWASGECSESVQTLLIMLMVVASPETWRAQSWHSVCCWPLLIWHVLLVAGGGWACSRMCCSQGASPSAAPRRTTPWRVEAAAFA